MEFDPSFEENFPDIFGIFSKTSCIKSEIPTMVHLKLNSTLFPAPSHDTSFLYQNYYHHFQEHPLNVGNYHPSFALEGLSSINPFYMIPTPSLDNSYRATGSNGSTVDLVSACYPMAFSPNDNKMEAIHGYLSNGKSCLDFFNKNPLEYSSIFQSQVGPSLSPLLVHDTHASMPSKPKLLHELSRVVGNGKNLQDTDLRLDVGDQKNQSTVHRNNSETHHNDINMMKGQWSIDEDRKTHGAKRRKKILIEAHKRVGNKWTQIAKRLPGRAENTIKNHWNATVRQLNVKRKQNRRKCGSQGTLLQMYIKEVTNAKDNANEMKPIMRIMYTGSTSDENNKNDQTLLMFVTRAQGMV